MVLLYERRISKRSALCASVMNGELDPDLDS